MPVTIFCQWKEGKRCYICGSNKHLLPQCPKKGKRAKEDYFINQFNGLQDVFFQQLYQHELIEAHRKLVDPNAAQGKFVFQQAYEYCPPSGMGAPPSAPQQQLQQVLTYIPGPSWDTQSHRSGGAPSYMSQGMQEQHAQQQQQFHQRIYTPFQAEWRPHFFQTVSHYFPMWQYTQITGVHSMLPLGQVHSQITVAERVNVVYIDSGSTVKILRNPLLFQTLYASP